MSDARRERWNSIFTTKAETWMPNLLSPRYPNALWSAQGHSAGRSTRRISERKTGFNQRGRRGSQGEQSDGNPHR